MAQPNNNAFDNWFHNLNAHERQVLADGFRLLDAENELGLRTDYFSSPFVGSSQAPDTSLTDRLRRHYTDDGFTPYARPSTARVERYAREQGLHVSPLRTHDEGCESATPSPPRTRPNRILFPPRPGASAPHPGADPFTAPTAVQPEFSFLGISIDHFAIALPPPAPTGFTQDHGSPTPFEQPSTQQSSSFTHTLHREDPTAPHCADLPAAKRSFFRRAFTKAAAPFRKLLPKKKRTFTVLNVSNRHSVRGPPRPTLVEVAPQLLSQHFSSTSTSTNVGHESAQEVRDRVHRVFGYEGDELEAVALQEYATVRALHALEADARLAAVARREYANIRGLHAIESDALRANEY